MVTGERRGMDGKIEREEKRREGTDDDEKPREKTQKLTRTGGDRKTLHKILNGY